MSGLKEDDKLKTRERKLERLIMFVREKREVMTREEVVYSLYLEKD